MCDGEIDCKMTPEEVKSMTGVVVPYLPTDGSAWHDEMNCGCEDESLFQCHDKPKICLNMTKVMSPSLLTVLHKLLLVGIIL